ncbi:MAG: PAS domain S-box protein [Flammeovirgaceae bacterium]|nr:PAS domain S-box protein [Flammeovirgaceae bacterium]
MNVQAREEFVLPFSKEELFYEDKKGSYCVQYEDLGGNTILVTRKGFASFKAVQCDLVIVEKILKEIRPYLKNSGIYFILDVRLYEGVTRKGRTLLLDFEKKLDKENIVSHVGIVGGVSYVLKMIRLVTYFFRNFSISFHDDLAGALSEIQIYKSKFSNLTDVSNQSDIEDTLLDSSWLNRKYIYSCGKKIGLVNRHEWNIYGDSGDYIINVFLLGEDILLVKDYGKTPKEILPKVLIIFEKVLAVSGKERMSVIIETSELYLFDNQINETVNLSKKNVIKHWDIIYKVSSVIDRLKLHLYKPFFPKDLPHVVTVSSIHEAIASILKERLIFDFPGEEAQIDKIEPPLEELSKEELISIIKKEKAENKNIIRNQDNRIHELIESLGQVSWSKDYRPKILNISPEDPFFDLFNTSNLLQQDVFEMLHSTEWNNDSSEWLEEELNEEKKEAEDKLNLKTFLENNDNTIWLINDKYELTDFNQNFLRVYYGSFKVKINVGENILDTTPSENMKVLWKKRYDKALSGQACEYIDRFPNQRNSENILLFRVFPIKLNQKITGVIVISQDITASEQAAEILRYNEKILDNIFNAVNVGMVLVNENGGIERVNQYFLTRFGYTNGEILKKKLEDILSSNAVERLNESKEKLSFESLGIQKGGNRLDIFVTGALFEGESKKRFKIITIDDISQRKHAENELQLKNKELEKVNRELDQFVYSVSHDLMAPLNSILGLITLSKLETDMEKIQEYLRLKEKSVNKLNEFTQDLINLSRDTRLEIQKENIDFKILLQELVEKYEYGENADKVKLALDVNQEFLFFSDKNRLKVIFGNLISNAFRYAMPHKMNPFVKVSVEVGNTEATLKIEDNGIGIKEKFQQKIFDMFYRANQEIKGSGLGLYIVREFVSKLNGKIELQSQFGEGSSFIITLPNLN